MAFGHWNRAPRLPVVEEATGGYSRKNLSNMMWL